jgi:uncharacterized membrane protein YjgN (DUF898 family)
MHPARFYTAVLAVLLIGQCWLFNLLAHDSHLLGVFPWLLGLVVVPFVILLAVRQRSHSSGGASASELRRFGWSVLWPASLAFGCFVAALSAVTFGPRPLPLVLFSFVAALGITLVVGVGSTEVVAFIVTRATSHGTHNRAA